MSIGFACALTPSGLGDLLIGTDALLASGATGVPNMADGRNQLSPVRCDVVFGEAALHAAKAAGVSARTGRIMTAGRVLVQATEKQAVAAASGAVGLDMESVALGAIAMEHRVAFLIARTVSDLVDEDLPLDFNLFLRPSGWARGALGLLRPASLVGLQRLRRQTALASERLTTFLERFLQDVLRGQP
jgi:adenosylhomocysteine nucleosidase